MKNPTTVFFLAILSAMALRAAEPVRLELGAGTEIDFITPAPVLWNGESLPDPVFDREGHAEVAGLRLHRTLEKVAGGQHEREWVGNFDHSAWAEDLSWTLPEEMKQAPHL